MEPVNSINYYFSILEKDQSLMKEHQNFIPNIYQYIYNLPEKHRLRRFDQSNISSINLDEYNELKNRYKIRNNQKELNALYYLFIERSYNCDILASALKEIRAVEFNKNMGSFINALFMNELMFLQAPLEKENEYKKLLCLIDSGEPLNEITCDLTLLEYIMTYSFANKNNIIEKLIKSGGIIYHDYYNNEVISPVIQPIMQPIIDEINKITKNAIILLKIQNFVEIPQDLRYLIYSKAIESLNIAPKVIHRIFKCIKEASGIRVENKPEIAEIDNSGFISKIISNVHEILK